MNDHVHKILIVHSLWLWDTGIVKVYGGRNGGKELTKTVNPLGFEMRELFVSSLKKGVYKSIQDTAAVILQ